MKSVLAWLKEVRGNAKSVGALFPSMPAVGKKIRKHIKNDGKPKAILELGAGDGAVTAQIVQVLKPGDRLELVEINPSFCEVLEKRIRGEWATYLKGVEVIVHSTGLENCQFHRRFDVVISGLPLINFGSDQVQEIYFQFQRLVCDGGQLLSFEYACSRRLKKMLGQVTGNRDLVKTCRLIEEFHQKNQVGWDPVLLNIPPMKVRRFFLGATNVKDESDSETSSDCDAEQSGLDAGKTCS